MEEVVVSRGGGEEKVFERGPTLKDWLVARAKMDPWWVREELLHEAERHKRVLLESLEGLECPSDDDDIHIERGWAAAQTLRAIFVALGELREGKPPEEIVLLLAAVAGDS